MRDHHPIRRSFPPTALLTAALLWATACDSMQLAPGDMNEITVVADPELWSEVGEDVQAALEPTVLTVTDEPTFRIAHVAPTDESVRQEVRKKQVLLIGSAEDPWMRTAVDEAGAEGVDAPVILAVEDVFSRNQRVTLLVLPPGGGEAEVRSKLGELSGTYDTRFRAWATARMFISGRDTALADTLAREAGFSLLLPEVYTWSREDSLYVFRNDNPSPDQLIRQFMVAWRTPVPASLDSVLSRDTLLRWREALIHGVLDFPQHVDSTWTAAGPTTFRGRPAYRLQAAWRNPPEAAWPAGGPFITRAVVCHDQDRVYLIDAWLYAPDRDKYEYMIQLETILDSFRCGETDAAVETQPPSEPRLERIGI